jgi:hypothetical protein
LITYYFVQAFQQGKKGMLIPDMPMPARDLQHCEMLVGRLANTRENVVGFARSGDPEAGTWGDVVVVAQHGDVPSEIYDHAI